MTMMAQQPNDDEIEQYMKMAAPKDDPTGMGLPVSMAAPVDPHATLTTPIGPPAPKVTMAAGDSADAPPKMAASQPKSAPASTKMSLLSPQEEHINKNLMADYRKDADPYGSPDNHPGFFGKLLHGLNVATGGVNRRAFEEQGMEGRLQNLSKQESEQDLQGAETAGKNEETKEAPQKADDAHNLSGATTEHLGAETNALEHPAPEYEVHDTAEGPMVVNKKTGVGQHLSVNGLPVGPKVQTKVVPLQIGGEDHQVLVNDNDGTVIKDLGKGGIKPPSVHVDTGEKNLFSVLQPDGTRKAVSIKAGDVIPKGAISLSGQSSETVASDKKDQAAAESARNMDDELGLMKQFAAAPSPTNDAAMLMHYIGATKPESMGKIRLNENEIKLFGGTRSSLGDAEALLTKVSNGQMLTPKQRQDMISTMTAITNATHRGGSGANASGQAKEGDSKVNGAGIKVKFSGGKWGPA